MTKSDNKKQNRQNARKSRAKKKLRDVFNKIYLLTLKTKIEKLQNEKSDNTIIKLQEKNKQLQEKNKELEEKLDKYNHKFEDILLKCIDMKRTIRFYNKQLERDLQPPVNIDNIVFN